MDQLIDAWINCVEQETEGTRYDWARNLVSDWVGGDPSLLFSFILGAYKRQMSDLSYSVLAAGPLEDLLSYQGEKFIGKIEELAKTDEKFNHLLGGVWKNAMPDDIWETVKRIRRDEW